MAMTKVAGPRKESKSKAEEPVKHPDGHNLINGARWHWPKVGSPSECGVSGCERVLGTRTDDPIDDLDGPDDFDDLDDRPRAVEPSAA